MSASAPTRPSRATFRLPVPALLFPVLLLFCILPLATAGGAWGVLFVVPVAALAWVIVTRTKATSTEVTAYGLLGAKRMAWTDMAGLELKDARWATAVALDGRRVRLPMVRPRDLPGLAAVSGGSLTLGGPIEPDARIEAESPTESTPAEVAPIETAPIETAPIEAAPIKAAPIKAAPITSAPAEPAP